MKVHFKNPYLKQKREEGKLICGGFNFRLVPHFWYSFNETRLPIGIKTIRVFQMMWLGFTLEINNHTYNK